MDCWPLCSSTRRWKATTFFKGILTEVIKGGKGVSQLIHQIHPDLKLESTFRGHKSAFSLQYHCLQQFLFTVVVYHDLYDLCHACDPVITVLFHSHCIGQREAENGIQFMKLKLSNNILMEIYTVQSKKPWPPQPPQPQSENKCTYKIVSNSKSVCLLFS